jgi:tetratricopeptide (TPR) repeat protein
MTEEETEKLLDEASGHYNDGRYDDAIGIWNTILEQEPGNERAIEGIKMANLLTSDWEPSVESAAGTQAAAAMDPELLARVEEGVQRVDQLLAAGDPDGAREGLEALEQIAPEHAGVQACSARIDAAANPSEYVEEQLAMARHYLMLGEAQEASAIAQKVLAVDPTNATATEILGDDPAGPAAPPADVAAPVEESPLELSLEPEAPDLDLPPQVDVPESPSPLAGGDPKVAALLAEGDELQAQGKHDEAIDAWSRVFILEDSNLDAEQRIDGARKALEERARQMEEGLIRATDMEKEGRLEEARAELQAVLSLRPGHAEAQEMLEGIQARIDAGEEEIEAIPLEAIDAVPAAETPAPEAPAPPPELPQFPPFPQDAGESGEAQTPTPPPKPPERDPVMRKPAPKRSGVLVAVIAVVGISVLGYGGWLAYQAFFPVVPMDDLSAAIPAPGETGADPGTSPDGGADGDEAAGGSQASAEPEPSQPSLDPEPARRRAAELVKSGSGEFEAGNFKVALTQFQEAVELDRANFQAQDWRDRAQAEVKKVSLFDQEMLEIQNLVDERDFRNALYKLYRVEPPDGAQQRRADSWIAATWHDWGVLLLQSGNPRGAVEKFQEALNAQPDDGEAARHLDVAERYSRRAVDEPFKTYASRLKLRGLE